MFILVVLLTVMQLSSLFDGVLSYYENHNTNVILSVMVS